MFLINLKIFISKCKTVIFILKRQDSKQYLLSLPKIIFLHFSFFIDLATVTIWIQK